MLFPLMDMSEWKGLRLLGLIMDHTFPLVVLLTEYIFLNSVPFINRHMPIVFGVGGLYMVFNMIYTLTNEPIYDPITWNSPMGIIIPILTIAVSLGIFVLLRKITKHKLRALGYTKILETMHQ